MWEGMNGGRKKKLELREREAMENEECRRTRRQITPDGKIDVQSSFNFTAVNADENVK